MAKKVIVQMIDDINGEEATETITFGYDGKSYEIDLTAENAQLLREQFGEWSQHARRAPATKSGQRRSRSSGSSNTSKIREWARANGYEVSARGRIPVDIANAYNAAQ